MPKRFRPYIPLSVRVQVAERQVDAAIAALGVFDPETDKHSRNLAVFRDFVDRESWRSAAGFGRQLSFLLRLLFEDGVKAELHHRPALINRPWNPRKKDYDPPANSPEHLIYLREDDHDVETRVRGVGALRSDLSQARYLKKVARNRGPKPKRQHKIPSRPFQKRRKP